MILLWRDLWKKKYSVAICGGSCILFTRL